MTRRTSQFYTYTERKIGGKRRRISDHRYPTRGEALRMVKSMRKLYGDKYTYSIIKAPQR